MGAGFSAAGSYAAMAARKKPIPGVGFGPAPAKQPMAIGGPLPAVKPAASPGTGPGTGAPVRTAGQFQTSAEYRARTNRDPGGVIASGPNAGRTAWEINAERSGRGGSPGVTAPATGSGILQRGLGGGSAVGSVPPGGVNPRPANNVNQGGFSTMLYQPQAPGGGSPNVAAPNPNVSGNMPSLGSTAQQPVRHAGGFDPQTGQYDVQAGTGSMSTDTRGGGGGAQQAGGIGFYNPGNGPGGSNSSGYPTGARPPSDRTNLPPGVQMDPNAGTQQVQDPNTGIPTGNPWENFDIQNAKDNIGISKEMAGGVTDARFLPSVSGETKKYDNPADVYGGNVPGAQDYVGGLLGGPEGSNQNSYLQQGQALLEQIGTGAPKLPGRPDITGAPTSYDQPGYQPGQYDPVPGAPGGIGGGFDPNSVSGPENVGRENITGSRFQGDQLFTDPNSIANKSYTGALGASQRLADANLETNTAAMEAAATATENDTFARVAEAGINAAGGAGFSPRGTRGGGEIGTRLGEAARQSAADRTKALLDAKLRTAEMQGQQRIAGAGQLTGLGSSASESGARNANLLQTESQTAGRNALDQRSQDIQQNLGGFGAQTDRMKALADAAATGDANSIRAYEAEQQAYQARTTRSLGEGDLRARANSLGLNYEELASNNQNDVNAIEAQLYQTEGQQKIGGYGAQTDRLGTAIGGATGMANTYANMLSNNQNFQINKGRLAADIMSGSAEALKAWNDLQERAATRDANAVQQVAELKIQMAQRGQETRQGKGVGVKVGDIGVNIGSDINLKENIEPVDGAAILEKVMSLPVSEWNYKGGTGEDATVRHIGPMAQDVHTAFALNDDSTHINLIDMNGILLAAVQELAARVKVLEVR